MKNLLIKNGKAIIGREVLNRDILISDGKIASADFTGKLPEDCEILDASGLYVSPGFIDIHVHGGGGYDAMDCSVEAFKNISYFHLINGTTAMIPTLMTAEITDIINVIEVYKKALPSCPNFYGLHLEGPFISPAQKGAHPEHLIHAPSVQEAELLLSKGKGYIRKITAAPELENMPEFADIMSKNGIQMVLGHSDATSDIALAAFENSFSHVTHLYSATPSVRKLNQVLKAGVIEAAYLNDNVSVELIADGKHAAVDALKLAVKIKGIDKVALVTDALRPAGTDVSESWLGEKIPENRIIIEDGVAKLPDRSSFAGSIATTAMLLERGVNHYGFSVADTVYMLSKTPAEIVGLSHKGKIEDNFDADIVIFDNNLDIKSVIIGGETVC